MFSSFFRSKKWALWAYGGLFLILLALLAQVQLNVAINQWYKDFYDIMQNIDKYTIDDFWFFIVKFLKIAMPYVLIAMATNYFGRIYTFRWREAMTFSYVDVWREVEKDIEGSSQRIQEDIYRFAKIVEDLGVRVVRALMILIAFLPILWEISSKVALPYLKDIEGSLVYVALIVSIGGLVISWFVGIKLPGLEYNNQKVEAAFRKELVYAEDDKISYAKPDTIISLVTGLRLNYHRLFLHYGYFDIWLISFEQIMVIVPFLLMGPSLFSGIATLGIMIQVSNAFDQVRSSLSIFILNWTTITELRSIHKRLREFEDNISYNSK